jgi:signal transduction histidine kinase
MGDDSVVKRKMPNFRISIYLLIIVILSVMLIVIFDVMNWAGTLFRYIQMINPVHLDTALIVLGFLFFALAFLIVWLWHELKQVILDYNNAEMSLHRSHTKLSFLNTIIREDIFNQLTELYADMGPVGHNPEIEKMRPAINRIHRQIKFTKEYQDIGTNAPEWQNVADTIMRAKVGVDLGKVTFELEIRDVEIYADRLLEKAFFYLIDNALKHGGEKLSKIRFYGKKSENAFVIVCQDDGVGIPKDKNSILFPKVSGRSVGYGLFLIKEILATTGISIRETGIPGAGARIEMVVPPGRYRQDKDGKM